MNRQQRRRRVRDHTYTSPGAKHTINDYRYQLEYPVGTNHERNMVRKLHREAAKANATSNALR